MPGLEDESFSRSVVYLCEHSERGALGLIINKPSKLSLQGLLQKVDLGLKREDLREEQVFTGGPVQTDRGFVLHRPLGNWQSTLAVTPELGLTSSRDVLQALGREGEPGEIIVALGYSGWGAGQLEHELAQNAWLTVPADPRVLFELPFEERLPSAMETLGVDFANLSETAGHA